MIPLQMLVQHRVSPLLQSAAPADANKALGTVLTKTSVDSLIRSGIKVDDTFIDSLNRQGKKLDQSAIDYLVAQGAIQQKILTAAEVKKLVDEKKLVVNQQTLDSLKQHAILLDKSALQYLEESGLLRKVTTCELPQGRLSGAACGVSQIGLNIVDNPWTAVKEVGKFAAGGLAAAAGVAIAFGATTTVGVLGGAALAVGGVAYVGYKVVRGGVEGVWNTLGGLKDVGLAEVANHSDDTTLKELAGNETVIGSAYKRLTGGVAQTVLSYLGYKSSLAASKTFAAASVARGARRAIAQESANVSAIAAEELRNIASRNGTGTNLQSFPTVDGMMAQAEARLPVPPLRVELPERIAAAAPNTIADVNISGWPNLSSAINRTRNFLFNRTVSPEQRGAIAKLKVAEDELVRNAWTHNINEFGAKVTALIEGPWLRARNALLEAERRVATAASPARNRVDQLSAQADALLDAQIGVNRELVQAYTTNNTNPNLLAASQRVSTLNEALATAKGALKNIDDQIALAEARAVGGIPAPTTSVSMVEDALRKAKSANSPHVAALEAQLEALRQLRQNASQHLEGAVRDQTRGLGSAPSPEPITAAKEAQAARSSVSSARGADQVIGREIDVTSNRGSAGSARDGASGSSPTLTPAEQARLTRLDAQRTSLQGALDNAITTWVDAIKRDIDELGMPKQPAPASAAERISAAEKAVHDITKRMKEVDGQIGDLNPVKSATKALEGPTAEAQFVHEARKAEAVAGVRNGPLGNERLNIMQQIETHSNELRAAQLQLAQLQAQSATAGSSTANLAALTTRQQQITSQLNTTMAELKRANEQLASIMEPVSKAQASVDAAAENVRAAANQFYGSMKDPAAHVSDGIHHAAQNQTTRLNAELGILDHAWRLRVGALLTGSSTSGAGLSMFGGLLSPQTQRLVVYGGAAYLLMNPDKASAAFSTATESLIKGIRAGTEGIKSGAASAGFQPTIGSGPQGAQRTLENITGAVQTPGGAGQAADSARRGTAQGQYPASFDPDAATGNANRNTAFNPFALRDSINRRLNNRGTVGEAVAGSYEALQANGLSPNAAFNPAPTSSDGVSKLMGSITGMDGFSELRGSANQNSGAAGRFITSLFSSWGVTNPAAKKAALDNYKRDTQ